MAIVNLLKNNIFFVFCVPNNKWSFRRFSWKKHSFMALFRFKKGAFIVNAFKSAVWYE